MTEQTRILKIQAYIDKIGSYFLALKAEFDELYKEIEGWNEKWTIKNWESILVWLEKTFKTSEKLLKRKSEGWNEKWNVLGVVKNNRQETSIVTSVGLRLGLLQKIRVILEGLSIFLKLWLGIFFMICWLGICFINECLDLANAYYKKLE